jgi:hypothetical protein
MRYVIDDKEKGISKDILHEWLPPRMLRDVLGAISP